MPLPAALVGLGRFALGLFTRAAAGRAATAGASAAGRAAPRSAAAASTSLGKPTQYIPSHGSGSAGGVPSAPSVVNVQTARGSGASLLEKLWSFQAATQQVAQLDSAFPIFVHDVVVGVSGGPYADIQRIWQLCTAAAFGKYREGPNFNMATSTVSYVASWDITDKVVSFHITSTAGGIAGMVEREAGDVISDIYANSGLGIIDAAADALGKALAVEPLVNAAKDGINPFRVSRNYRARSNSPLDYLLLGPSQETVGGKPPAIFGYNGPSFAGTKIIGGIPATAIAKAIAGTAQSTALDVYNQFPDDGRLITTGYKMDPNCQNPVPPLDGLARSSLVSLVAATLTNTPSYFPAKPPTLNTTPFNALSPRLYNAGSPQPSNLNDKVKSWFRRWPLSLFTLSWDGYKPINNTDVDVLPGKDNNVERFTRVGV